MGTRDFNWDLPKAGAARRGKRLLIRVAFPEWAVHWGASRNCQGVGGDIVTYG